MQNVKVARADVLKRVKANREDHKKIVHEALDGFRAAVIKELDRMIADAKKGKEVRTYVNLTQPEDHTKEYDNVIDMMEMSLDAEITLSAIDFQRYVRDEWAWSDQFLSANSMYSGTAVRKLSIKK